MDESHENQNDENSLESLESGPSQSNAPATPSSSTTTPTTDTVRTEPTNLGEPVAAVVKKRRTLRNRLQHTNIYFLAFCLLLVIASGVAGYIYLNSKQTKQATENLSSQSLSSTSLSQLANSGVSVGDPKQILNVQSNSIFSGKVLVRDDLEVAGRLLVGSSLSLAGITVSGQSTFDDVQVTKDLSVTGNAAIQGKMSARNISSGDGNFSGTVTASQLATNSLQLNGNLTLTRHIIAGGATPGRTNGGALGSGGTSTIAGSDTSGSITINTGGSPAAGCFITVNFTQKFNSIPHVIITPVGAAAANVGYYVSRNTSNFSVCATSGAPAGQSFGFDYLVLE